MSNHFEVAIIGAGPSGLGAATNAAFHDLSHILFEKAEVGNTIFEYQLRKHVMAEPNKLPLRAKVKFEAGLREEILDQWNQGLEENKVNLVRAEVTAIKKVGDRFEISAGQYSCTATHVVLSVGIQGSPRKVGVPGGELPHVGYTLRDPDEFRDEDILVIGAGDAAIENAVALAENNRVSILNRSDEFSRAKDGNVALIMAAIESKKINCLYNADLKEVEDKVAHIETAEQGLISIKCDRIIARIGAIPPRKFLEGCGIEFPSPDPLSVPVVNKRYECNVPNLFLLGSLIGYPLIKHGINQGYEVIEHILGNDIEPADQILIEEKLGHLPGETGDNFALIQSQLPLFKELSDPQFRELIIESSVLCLKKGETVFELNDYTDTFFSIIKGQVAISLPGKEILIDQGDFFGEMSLLSGRRRSATIKAANDVWLLETPRKQILKLIASVDSVKATINRKFMANALRTSIFQDLEVSLINNLVGSSTFKNFKKGEVLFREGDEADALYVIRKGSLKISRLNEKGVDVTQKYLPAGHFVGEMALLKEGARRNATVSAAVACETIVINKEQLLQLLRESPEARARIEKVAQERQVENVTSNQHESAGKLLDFVIAQGVSDADNVLIIDSDLCIACDNCEAACAATHGGYTRLDRKGGKSFASIQIPISCRHCENPLCMTDCPPDALVRRADGEVIIQDSCIGCGNCVRNCPYGVIQMVYEKKKKPASIFAWLGGSSFAKEKGPAKAGKCDMCSTLPGGPACVRSCPTGAALRVNPVQITKMVEAKQR